MIVTCLNCSTRLQLDEAKIPARPFSVRCPKCQQIINTQPTAQQQQRDAVSAVGGVPVSTRSQQEMSATPAAPLSSVNVESEADARAQQAQSPSEELLRLLASLLRGETAASTDFRGAKHRARDGKRVLVCAGSPPGERAARVLAGGGYIVFSADSAAQASERLREERVDVIVLDPEFDHRRQGAVLVGGELLAMRMPERRRVVFVQLNEKARTGDAHAAFVAGANLVVNTSDVEDLPRLIEKNVRDLNELYRDFNRALNLAEL
ncbi:MAG TPA: zinc-ribbon domain-containing protein [Pyrinomonadaceae bacterium]|jgi:predicted Zn finger-like uncharacterized protein|nr:zinc-ribbon domain-containing protein [Pyrinomonadaceae bacterium]